MAIYIKTSRKNYAINLIISGLLTLVSGFLLYTRLSSEVGKVLLTMFCMYISFLYSFRTIEYILTKKSIITIKVFWFGDIDSGKRAKLDFFFSLTILLIFELLILYYYFL
jgi:hypothetical protein